MWRMSGGYITALSVACASWIAIHPDDWPAFFLVLLVMGYVVAEFIATSGSPKSRPTTNITKRKLIRHAIDTRVISRPHAFGAGIVGAALAVAAVMGTWWLALTVWISIWSLIAACVLTLGELCWGWFIGAAYLEAIAEQRIPESERPDERPVPQSDQAHDDRSPAVMRLPFIWPFLLIWHAPFLLLFWYPWSVVAESLGVILIGCGVFFIWAWRSKSLRHKIFTASVASASRPPYFTIIGSIIFGVLCFVFANN